MVDAGRLAGRARAIADEIAQRSPESVQIAKQLIDADGGGLSVETIAAGLALALPNGREGAQAFMARRRPEFVDAGVDGAIADLRAEQARRP